jgi:LEA14-like dessication related protein
MKNILSIFSLFVFLLTFQSCEVKEVEVGNIKSFNIVNIDKEYVTIDLTAPINNPNNFSFTISKVNLDLTFNNVNLGKIDEVERLKIPKNSNEVQHLIFKLKLEQIMKGSMLFIPALLTNKAKIKVKGYVKASKFPFGKKIDVDYDKTTKISKEY